MKVVDREMVSYNPVIGEWETTIEVTLKELEEFKKALDVINRFKGLAMAEHKINESNADWTMVDYNQEKDYGWNLKRKKEEGIHKFKVIVNIKQGMCG